jgi:putative MFS transporter
MSKLESIVEKEYRRSLPTPAAPQLVTTGRKFRDMWVKPYGTRATMMIIFNVFQTIGFYGFANWVPTLLIKQGITVTASLLYSSIIAVAAPIGPIIGLFIGDRFERKTVIVATAAAIVVCGMVFSQSSGGVLLIAMG